LEKKQKEKKPEKVDKPKPLTDRQKYRDEYIANDGKILYDAFLSANRAVKNGSGLAPEAL